ncbi:hypothetical protein C7437_10930 [Psychrobacillus insolitus]|uniref:Uncharacterized protein n=1 Tax=Psychrobacillus insolitus TaxID=1461 RepID=A0A2W7MDR0_9BACI|nr:hypothetical protein [Psychrobacillus insolitus]PZX02885.1 hypothetical protein C7437_10930 [Psychrobacillus insolitus]
MTNKNDSGSFEIIMSNVLKLPGIKVDRKEFLAKSFSNYVSSDILSKVLDKGPVEANVDIAKSGRGVCIFSYCNGNRPFK